MACVPLAILNEVWAERITLFRHLKSVQKLQRTINAFLTLSAVTKW